MCKRALFCGFCNVVTQNKRIKAPCCLDSTVMATYQQTTSKQAEHLVSPARSIAQCSEHTHIRTTCTRITDLHVHQHALACHAQQHRCNTHATKNISHMLSHKTHTLNTRPPTPTHVPHTPVTRKCAQQTSPHYEEGAPKYAASRNKSLNTPPAVTSAPAPGPRMISGCCRYRAVVNAIILSLPLSCAKGWVAG